MEFIKTKIDGVWITEPKVFSGDKDYFFESFKQSEFDKGVGYHIDFIQDNESKPNYDVLRGLHYQEGDTTQAKLVRIIKGRVVDVAIDPHRNSPTLGKYVMAELSDKNKCQFFVPRGSAHGFLVLSDGAVSTYKVDNVYSPQTEASLCWDDKTVIVEWPIDAKDVILSDKDLNKELSLEDVKVFEQAPKSFTISGAVIVRPT